MSSDESVQLLRGIERELDSVEGLDVEAEAGWDHGRTLETHFASQHGDHVAPTAAGRRDEPRAVGDARLHQLVRRRGLVSERTPGVNFLERSAEAHACTSG